MTSDDKSFRNPHNLPSKNCKSCGKAFTWRKKWLRCWDSVSYCSDRCRHQRPRHPTANLCGAASVEDEF